jgi:hypothetical protein
MLLKVPGKQNLQFVEPGRSEKCPVLHFVQLNCPALHTVHSIALPVLYVNELQSVQSVAPSMLEYFPDGQLGQKALCG